MCATMADALFSAFYTVRCQDVNGDSVLHWAAREISAAFLRQVLHLARKHGTSAQELTAVLQARIGYYR